MTVRKLASQEVKYAVILYTSILFNLMTHYSFNDPCKSTSVNRYIEISFETIQTYSKLGSTQPKKMPSLRDN